MARVVFLLGAALLGGVGGLRSPAPAPRARLRRSRVGGSAGVTSIGADGKARRVFCEDSPRVAERARSWAIRGADKAARWRRLTDRAFYPEDVTPEYASYTRWRCVQRLLSATVNVFGLQAMIMAVGIRDSNAAAAGAIVGAAAAFDWVLKDALGKVTRLVWAGRMGREFDGDAKRWRFRSSLLYATGNGLQIATFAFPRYFLALAAFANCFKQISMLTSTATRSAIYRSFAATEATNNLGDVTAKGEAQIAIVDLFGLALGLWLSRRFGLGSAAADRRLLVAFYGALSVLEIGAMYREIRCVVFRSLNLDRALAVVEAFAAGDAPPTPAAVAREERILWRPHVPRSAVFAPPKTIIPHLRSGDLERAITAAKDDAYLVLPRPRGGPPVILLAPAATPDDVLDALLCRAYGAADLGTARARTAATRDGLRDAMRASGWSTASFLLPDVAVRAVWAAPGEAAPP